MEAEALRLRHQTSRIVVRAVLACVAIILLFGAVVFLHIAIWCLLRESLTRHHTALALCAMDLLLAVVPAVLSARSAPGRVEREAYVVRRQAIDDGMQSFTLSAQLARFVGELISRPGR